MIKEVRMIIFSLLLVANINIADAEQALTTNQCSSDLTQSNISEAALVVWANEAAVATFTYDFVNFETQLQTASNYFTPNGWKEFYKALEQSENLKALQAKKLLVTAVPFRTPIILQAGLLNGRYSWRVQIPLQVTFQNSSEYAQQNLAVTMLIARASPYEGVRGLVVLQYQVGPWPKEEENRSIPGFIP